MKTTNDIVKTSPEARRKDSFFTRLPLNRTDNFFFQPKLTIGPTDDVYEREADAVADKVMRMMDNEQIQTKISPVLMQRKCAACEEEKHVRRKEGNVTQQPSEAPPIVVDAL